MLLKNKVKFPFSKSLFTWIFPKVFKVLALAFGTETHATTALYIELEPLFAQHIPTGKTLLLSEILDRQIDELLAHYQLDFSLEKTVGRNEWPLLKLRRNSF